MSIKTRTLTWIFVSLLASIVVWSCNGNSQSGGRYGGPYPKQTIEAQKIADFGVYFAKEIFFSEGTELDSKEGLEESIRSYIDTENKFPYGGEFQRYNYVIDESYTIIVATWSFNLDFDQLRGEQTQEGRRVCDGNGEAEFPNAQKGMMINFYPEVTIDTNHSEKSPCKMGVPGPDTAAGLLDASSKHFMLAQEQGKRQIREYNPQPWIESKVEYAGEIIVEIRRDDTNDTNDTNKITGCDWTINDNSGTYKPSDGQNLEAVARRFVDVLGSGPTHLWDNAHVEEYSTRRENPEDGAAQLGCA